MKKLIAMAFVSLAVVAGTTGQASAFFHCLCCGKPCGYTVEVRQYNAFTPYCSGHIYCDGCAPQIPACCGYGPYAGTPMGPYAGAPAAPYAMGQLPPAGAMAGAPAGMPMPPYQGPAMMQAPYGMMQ